MRVLGLFLTICALVAAGCGGESTAEEATTATTTAPPETEPAAAPPADTPNRPPAPATEGETLDGERISLADFRGRPVFVNVWSSW